MLRPVWPLTILSLLLPFATAAAYVRITLFDGSTPRWTEMPIRYAVHRDGLTSIPNGSEFAGVHAAFATWASVSTAGVRFEYTGSTAAPAVGLDGTNLITFAEDNAGLMGSTTLAATFSFFQGSGSSRSFREADIAFNPAHAFTTSGEAGKFDIQSVLTHEIGHMLGLDHSGLISSVMAPFAAANQTDQRVLQYDDAAGVSEIYPSGSGAATLGAIRGSVRSDGEAVFGAHIVAVDQDGTPWVGTLSQPDGTYLIRFLPPGDYRVYAEPLEGPVLPAHIGGFYSSVDTDFGTTYFPNVRFRTEAGAVRLSSGGVAQNVDIATVPAGASGLNLTFPPFAARAPIGTSGRMRVGGRNVVDGVIFSASNPAVRFDKVTFGGEVSSSAPTHAELETVVGAEVPVGPKNIIGSSSDATSILTGGIVISEPPPKDIAVSPSEAGFEGGARVTITGRNFRPGARVLFSGLPSTDVQYLDPGRLQATVPGNSPGPANVQVFNTDGTAGVLVDGFFYTSPPPRVSGVDPRTGPPGTVVTIQGDYFDTRGQNVDVRINGQPARILTTRRTRIEAVVPYGATTGSLTVSVFGVTADAGAFTVTAPEPSTNTAPAAYSFIDATPQGGGINVSFSNNDDAVYFTNLPFNFSLFADTFVTGERISIATNGWISLTTSSSPEFQNASLPAATVERPTGSQGVIAAALIAPFFDDLVLDGADRVSTRLVGAEPDRRYIVQWTGLSILDSEGHDLGADLTFELILYEGSNDVQFVYQTMSGSLSDGSGATIGMQNLARNAAIQTGFNQSVVASGVALTYRFDNGRYLEERAERRPPPGPPVVTDGGDRTSSVSELFASWTSEASGSTVTEFEYAIGTTPGGADVRAFTPVRQNSVLATGLSLEPGKTYYFAVRVKSDEGTLGANGVSNGILVDTSFVPSRTMFPAVVRNAASFGGIALMASAATDVVLKAIDPDGGLPMGLGIRNPTAVRLKAGEQWARLIPEIFGLESFDGWIEVEASQPDLRAYMATVANDLAFFDGVEGSLPVADQFLFHAGASAMLVNPASEPVTVTITDPVTLLGQTMEIPARSRRTMILASAPVRVTAPSPVAAVEQFGPAGSLAIGRAVWDPRASLVFPHAAVGGGYRSWITLANAARSTRSITVSFAGRSASFQLAGRATCRFSVSELLGISEGALTADAVRIHASRLFSSSESLVGVIDIENDLSVVTLAAVSERREIVFPHVADGNGFFTGMAIAAGPAGANVTIEVFTPSGTVSGAASVNLPANGHRAQVLREWIRGFTGQGGGYIRLRSDEPIAAWEIYGTDRAMASGPPM